MTTQKHNETMTRLAEQQLASLLDGIKMTLRAASSEGISIEADAAVDDGDLTTTLHNLASHWGYRHGECPITIEALPGGFFEPAKRGTLKFV